MAEPEKYLRDRVTLHCGDCLAVLPTLAENSVDAVICDPPYHLTSIVDRYAKGDAKTENSIKLYGTQRVSPYMRGARGFMNKEWDGGDVAFRVETWREVMRVMKSGAHLVAFGGTRTFARMSVAIEDAGFEIRDTIMWLYGSGFPKSHSVSKGIDRAAGAERRIVGAQKLTGTARIKGGSGYTVDGSAGNYATADMRNSIPITASATDAARQWDGWGTALKPACEPIVLARKPLSESTIATNVLKWRTGAINVDGCRVRFAGDTDANESKDKNRHGDFGTGPRQNAIYGKDERNRGNYDPPGRWPANVVHDGSDEVTGAFPDSGDGHWSGETPSLAGRQRLATEESTDEEFGSAARFFYTAKANADDRLGSKHPTVKPLDLIQWLVRLVTPPGGTVLDPFAGTGTTAEASWREGMQTILIEREAEYQADIRRRIALCLSGPDERSRESMKARQAGQPTDHGPLFGGTQK